MDIMVVKAIAAAACMAVGSISPSFACGWIASKGLEAMGRNPEVSDKMFPSIVVAMAICESVGIYCLVVSLIILFVL